jgi:hypothetical protein
MKPGIWIPVSRYGSGSSLAVRWKQESGSRYGSGSSLVFQWNQEPFLVLVLVSQLNGTRFKEIDSGLGFGSEIQTKFQSSSE